MSCAPCDAKSAPARYAARPADSDYAAPRLDDCCYGKKPDLDPSGPSRAAKALRLPANPDVGMGVLRNPDMGMGMLRDPNAGMGVPRHASAALGVRVPSARGTMGTMAMPTAQAAMREGSKLTAPPRIANVGMGMPRNPDAGMGVPQRYARGAAATSGMRGVQSSAMMVAGAAAGVMEKRARMARGAPRAPAQSAPNVRAAYTNTGVISGLGSDASGDHVSASLVMSEKYVPPKTLRQKGSGVASGSADVMATYAGKREEACGGCGEDSMHRRVSLSSSVENFDSASLAPVAIARNVRAAYTNTGAISGLGSAISGDVMAGLARKPAAEARAELAYLDQARTAGAGLVSSGLGVADAIDSSLYMGGGGSQTLGGGPGLDFLLPGVCDPLTGICPPDRFVPGVTGKPTFPNPGPPRCVPRYCVPFAPPGSFSVGNCTASQYVPGPPYWVNADGGDSIPLPNGTSVFLFGDTVFWNGNVRPGLTKLHKDDIGLLENTVGVGRCAYYQAPFEMTYYWRRAANGDMHPIFAAPQPGDKDTTRLWPTDGFYYEGRLFVLLVKVRYWRVNAGVEPPEVSFFILEWLLGIVENPSNTPDTWCVRYFHLTDGEHAYDGSPFQLQVYPDDTEVADPNLHNDFRNITPDLGMVPPGPTGSYIHFFGSLFVDWGEGVGPDGKKYARWGRPGVLLRLPVSSLPPPIDPVSVSSPCGRRRSDLTPALQYLGRYGSWSALSNLPLGLSSLLTMDPPSECQGVGAALYADCHDKLAVKTGVRVVVRSPGNEHRPHPHPRPTPQRQWLVLSTRLLPSPANPKLIDQSTNVISALTAPALVGPWTVDRTYPIKEVVDDRSLAAPAGVFCSAVAEHLKYRATGQLVASYVCNQGSVKVDVQGILPKARVLYYG